jgi:hypothetical protein
MVKIFSIPAPGAMGADVKSYQLQLAKVGGKKLTPDGIFGGVTKKLTAEFQVENKLPGSGIPGPITLALLGLEIGVYMPDGSPTITKDIVGKKSRKLHPTLRVLMEKQIFPGGVVPISFKTANIPQCVIDTSMGMNALAIRERGGNNYGKDVGMIQDIIGSNPENGNGDAWCMSTVQCIVAFIEDYFQIESPMPDTEGVMDCFTKSQGIKDLLVYKPEAGTAFLGKHGTDWRGHTGMILSTKDDGSTMETFEGNTSSDSICARAGRKNSLRIQI